MKQILTLLLMTTLFVGCNVLSSDSDKLAETYVVSKVYADMNIQYKTNNGFKVINSSDYFDYTEKNVYRFEVTVEPIENPEIRVTNNTGENVMTNASVYASDRTKPLSSVGGNLYPSQTWKIVKGQFTR